MAAKILVVDDDPTTRHLISHQLRRAGYTVAEAVDGQKALERVRKELPHGEVTVRPVVGGLKVPGSDTLIACVAITVSMVEGSQA